MLTHDEIRIRMVKAYDESVFKPLEMVFKGCTEIENFSNEWKKAKVIPIHKKG